MNPLTSSNKTLCITYIINVSEMNRKQRKKFDDLEKPYLKLFDHISSITFLLITPYKDLLPLFPLSLSISQLNTFLSIVMTLEVSSCPSKAAVDFYFFIVMSLAISSCSSEMDFPSPSYILFMQTSYTLLFFATIMPSLIVQFFFV